ncbi:hypothetical protein L6R52_38410 [Myxococcota bacterium]|nr:hypothetical protein [Myxococcota bacterium]
MIHERIGLPQVQDAPKARQSEAARAREAEEAARRAELAQALEVLEAKLVAIADEIVRGTLAPDIREGVVMTVGPVPYRRLDCDGRALAYVKTRPKKRAVRIDVSGLWLAPQGSRLRIRSSTGAALMVTCEDDVGEAIAFLKQTVELTRTRRRRSPSMVHGDAERAAVGE